MSWSERYAGEVIPFPKKECYYCGNNHDDDLEKIDKGVWACKNKNDCSKRVPAPDYE